MTQPVQEADIAPDLNPSEAKDLRRQQDHLQALCRRFETAAALKRVRDQLRARASWDQSCDHDRKHDRCDDNRPDPDGDRS